MASRRWYFQGRNEEWLAYSEADISVLEAVHSSDPRGKHHVQLGPGKFSYEVDLAAMVQRNTKTGTERLIKVQEEPAVGTKEICDVFAQFDKDADGRISREELTQVLSELGMASSTVRTLLSAADTDRNGMLDYREFVAWICGGSDLAMRISSHFDMLVLHNRDGHLSVLVHPLDGVSASLKLPNGTLTRIVRERGDSWVVKYDGEDFLVKKHHALDARKGLEIARQQGVFCDPSIVAGAAAACKKIRWEEDESEEDWRLFNGSVLEPALTVDEKLRESPVRLVNAYFIVELARRGGRLPRRQDLPEECFISLEQLKRLPNGESLDRRKSLAIVAVSHPWQQPDHPDPKGYNLQILARALFSYLKEHPIVAVFLDFLSVHQKGPNLEDRTPEEWELFRQALTNMMDWYAHPKILTFKINRLPRGYPSGFDFPEGCVPNTAGYFERGWCFCESSVSNLAKAVELVLDLGDLPEFLTGWRYPPCFAVIISACAREAKRRPPISPQQFATELSTKQFTSKAKDEKMVSRLYKNTFKAWLGTAKVLNFRLLDWGDEELAVLAQTLASEVLPNLEVLNLAKNKIGDPGCTALAEASRAGMPKLQKLDLKSNQIGDGGCTALAETLASEVLPNLEVLNLARNKIGDPGCTALAEASEAGMPKLQELDLTSNQIGDGGCTALAEACTDPGCTALAEASEAGMPKLQVLHLGGNQIGDGGCTALAEACTAGAWPNLAEVRLQGNPIGDAGCTAWAEACAAGALPHLELLHLDRCKISEGCHTSLRRAWAQQHKKESALRL